MPVLFVGRITQHMSHYIATYPNLLGFEPSDSVPCLNIPEEQLDFTNHLEQTEEYQVIPKE